MPFPTIPTGGRILNTLQANATSPRTFGNLSSLTKNSGDLLIAIIACYQSSAGAGAPGGTVFSSWGGSFTEFCDQMTTASSTIAIGAAYKISTGSETGTFTVAQAATITGHAAMTLLSIPGWHGTTPPEVGTIANGTAAAANPDSFNPSWATDDTLWISVSANGETGTGGAFTGNGTSPSGFGSDNHSGITQDAVGGMEVSIGFQQLNADSLDVGTWVCDVSNARNSALVIAVRGQPPVENTHLMDPRVIKQQAIQRAIQSRRH